MSQIGARISSKIAAANTAGIVTIRRCNFEFPGTGIGPFSRRSSCYAPPAHCWIKLSYGAVMDRRNWFGRMVVVLALLGASLVGVVAGASPVVAAA